MEYHYSVAIRKLFIAAAVVVALGLPFIYGVFPKLFFIGFFSIFAITVVAGFLSPAHWLVLALDVCVAAVGIFLFESYAIFAIPAGEDGFFVLYQVLAVIFFFALYYSIRAARDRNPHHAHADDDTPAMRTLKLRYLSGEIKRNDFEEKLEELRRLHDEQDPSVKEGGFDSSGDG